MAEWLKRLSIGLAFAACGAAGMALYGGITHLVQDHQALHQLVAIEIQREQAAAGVAKPAAEAPAPAAGPAAPAPKK